MRITNIMIITNIYLVLLFLQNHIPLSLSGNIPVHIKWIKPKDSFSQLHHISWEVAGTASFCQLQYHLGWSLPLSLNHLALTKQRFHLMKNCHIFFETPATWKFCCDGRESFAEWYFKERPWKNPYLKRTFYHLNQQTIYRTPCET